MPVRFNHTILPARDAARAVHFTAEILGLAYRKTGVFHAIDLEDQATIDYVTAGEDAAYGHHVAFLVDDNSFDAILDRVLTKGIKYWADPRMHREGEINHLYGGRGFYFDDLDGNHLEVITAPYAK
jgi:catechol 2,3-dioxygenase-like lactoylglutathione lyase family enzyme